MHKNNFIAFFPIVCFVKCIQKFVFCICANEDFMVVSLNIMVCRLKAEIFQNNFKVFATNFGISCDVLLNRFYRSYCATFFRIFCVVQSLPFNLLDSPPTVKYQNNRSTSYPLLRFISCCFGIVFFIQLSTFLLYFCWQRKRLTAHEKKIGGSFFRLYGKLLALASVNTHSI